MWVETYGPSMPSLKAIPFTLGVSQRGLRICVNNAGGEFVAVSLLYIRIETLRIAAK